jgi:gamma-glutamylcyclotransferase (GGCT)/AIG2-like uncharacterized protein YtfP
MYVFVYGSLKRGFSNHQLMKSSKFICETYTKKRYAMVDLHAFPGILKDRDVSNIHGEVYDVDDHTLEQLDIFEGKWYERGIVELNSGFSAQIYFLKNAAINIEHSKIIETGIWIERPHKE